nr:FAD:protein FMN transferase [Bacillus sp. DNRA2]
MNTDFYISISNSEVDDWKDQLIEWFSYVDREWSRFNSDNELARLNGLTMGQTLTLSQPLFDLLQKAENYRLITGGRFSPYLAKQLQYHGYQQSFPFQNAEPNLQSIGVLVQECPFLYDASQCTATRKSEGQVEFGGLGKGYAVEAAMIWLKTQAKANSGMVDGGGDMSLWSDGKKEWNIGIADPFDPNRTLRQITLKNGSVATSNIIYRSWQQGTEKKHHILNGITGMPVETDIIQATVITTNCLDAEVLAKLCFMENPQVLNQSFSNVFRHFEYILVDQNGDLMISKERGING